MAEPTRKNRDNRNPSDALTHFDQRASQWNELYSRPQFRDRLRLFVESVCSRVTPGGRILDYGCGTGTIAIELARAGYEVIGVDGAEGMIGEARAIANKLDLHNIEFAHLSDPDSWQPDDTYDGVVCSSVIEYVADDHKLAGKLASAVGTGGWIFVSIPSRTSLVGKIEDLITSIGHRDRDLAFAKRRYSLHEFSTLLATNQLQTERIITFEFPVLGSIGVLMSRVPLIGVMALVIARKN